MDDNAIPQFLGDDRNLLLECHFDTWSELILDSKTSYQQYLRWMLFTHGFTVQHGIFIQYTQKLHTNIVTYIIYFFDSEYLQNFYIQKYNIIGPCIDINIYVQQIIILVYRFRILLLSPKSEK